MQAKTIFNNLYTSKYFANLPEFQQKRTQAFITLTLTLIALSFFGLFAIMPTVSTIANLQKQKEDNAFVEKKLLEKKGNLGTLSQAYIAIQSDLTYVYAAVPKNPEIPKLSGQLFALGNKAHIEISRIQSSEVELTKTQEGVQQFSSFPISIETTGTYENLKTFLDSLTTFERIITIDSITVSKGENGLLKMTIQAKGYFKL